MDDQILQDLRQAAAGGKPASGDPVLDDLRAAVANPVQPEVPATSPTPTPWWEKAVGAGEAALSTVSGMAAAPIAAARGGARFINNAIDAAAGRPSAEDIPNLVEQTRQSLTYTPRTQAGRDYTGNIGQAIDASKTSGAVAGIDGFADECRLCCAARQATLGRSTYGSCSE